MKTIKLLAGAILFAITTTGFAQSDVYVVRQSATPCLNVRDTADADSPSSDCLAPGTQVKVLSNVPFWREISYGNNKKGWVAKKFIEPQSGNVSPAAPTSIPANAFLTIHFVDVGQGDAIWIQTHDDGIDGNGIFEGYTIVIDGGPYSADSSNPLLPYMEDAGHHGAEIEALIVTHPHDDHYSGAETISRHFNINHFYEPGYPLAQTTTTYRTFISAMKGDDDGTPRARNIHMGGSTFGQMNWGSEIKVEVLYAWNGDPQNVLGSESNEENNSSTVIRVEYGNHVFLFMGDAEGKERADSPATPRFVEKILLDTQASKLKATVLKIAHHGSETSSTLPFIQAVNPDIVVVQSGRKKFQTRFLPDRSTLDRYCTNNPNVRIFRTDQGDEGLGTREAVDGDHVVIKTNGAGQPQVTAMQGGQPFTPSNCNH